MITITPFFLARRSAMWHTFWQERATSAIDTTRLVFSIFLISPSQRYAFAGAAPGGYYGSNLFLFVCVMMLAL
jgi:hypothetical protein